MGKATQMTTDPELKIVVQVIFRYPWCPEVSDDAQQAYEFRLHNDNSWEFLDRKGLPILQGMKARLEVTSKPDDMPGLTTVGEGRLQNLLEAIENIRVSTLKNGPDVHNVVWNSAVDTVTLALTEDLRRLNLEKQYKNVDERDV